MSNQNNQGGNNQVSYDKVKTQDSPLALTKNVNTIWQIKKVASKR